MFSIAKMNDTSHRILAIFASTLARAITHDCQMLLLFTLIVVTIFVDVVSVVVGIEVKESQPHQLIESLLSH